MWVKMSRCDSDEKKKKHRDYQKEWRKKNPERARAISKRYRESHRDAIAGKHASEEYLEYERMRRAKANAESIEKCDKDIYHKRWADDEVIYLIENYQEKTIPELAFETGRTIAAIERKRNKLGLRKEKK